MEPTPGLAPAIIYPEIGCESFVADGVTYTRTDGLAVGRARLLQRFQTELQFNMSIPTVQRSLVEMREFLKANNHYDSCVILNKLIDGADLLGANRMREAEICALFYNAPNEDPTTYDHKAITRKVEQAWGAVSADFFTHAAFWLLLNTSTRYQLPLSPAEADPNANDLTSS